MRGPFHPSFYDTATPVSSYWEATASALRPPAQPVVMGDHDTDVAIIGGGYTGLGAAITLVRDLGVAATVIEAGPIGFGASGRNGGQCSIDCTKLGLEDVFRQFGAWEARRYYTSQFEAIHWLRALCHDEGMNIGLTGEAAWVPAHSPAEAAHLRQYAEVLARGLDADAGFHPPEVFAERVMHLPFRRDGRFGGLFGAMRVAPGFGLHPLLLCLGLARAAQRHGAQVFAHSQVVQWRRDPMASDGRTHHLMTPQGRVRARRVILATNGFPAEGLVPGDQPNPLAGASLPVLSNIIVTRPLAAQMQLGPQATDPVADSWRLLHYWRMLPDGCLMLGMRGDRRGDAAGARTMRRVMAARLSEMVPGAGADDIAYFWRGPICATWPKRPAVGLADDRSIGYAFGYHGNGVNSAAFCGAMVARALIDGHEQTIPAVYRGPARPFPLPGLRPLYLRAALGGFALGDAWDRLRNRLRPRKSPVIRSKRLDSAQ